MKRYLLFAGHCHYPRGGVADFRKDSDSIDELKAHFSDIAKDIAKEQCSYIDNWGHIVESSTMKVISRGHADGDNDPEKCGDLGEVEWKKES